MKQIESAEIKLELDGILFTWDDEKEKINIRKHGVDFRAAASIFIDKDAIIEYNSTDDYTGEERWDTIGILNGALLFVVYVERVTIDNNDIIKIISARYAGRKERKRYVNGN